MHTIDIAFANHGNQGTRVFVKSSTAGQAPLFELVKSFVEVVGGKLELLCNLFDIPSDVKPNEHKPLVLFRHELGGVTRSRIRPKIEF